MCTCAPNWATSCGGPSESSLSHTLPEVLAELTSPFVCVSFLQVQGSVEQGRRGSAGPVPPVAHRALCRPASHPRHFGSKHHLPLSLGASLTVVFPQMFQPVPNFVNETGLDRNRLMLNSSPQLSLDQVQSISPIGSSNSPDLRCVLAAAELPVRPAARHDHPLPGHAGRRRGRDRVETAARRGSIVFLGQPHCVS